ncbi:hypothetical protein [Alteraurantiacibacter buctensis]|uniref:Uncharacterized protein n=1 Tax=Alteraurantiacibacter buctensis TaxID=1503981 RepID=A0A844YYJ6_9SPHN|nr:hypothetical protein [Alteraurantiacibacter buctensis]MXO72252.1 hypothetical protein [Alteraurantiacibacter buctensis]
MPDFLRLVSTLREQMQAELSRSDVLRVLIWPILILLLIFISATYAKAPGWALVAIAAFAGLFLAIYAISFIYLLFTDRDALRSEKYSLHKMAIQHGIYGDSNIGLIEAPKRSAQNLEPDTETGR